jgi:RecA-family ATPase
MTTKSKTNLGKDRKTSWTGEELVTQDLGEVQWLIKDILPQGFLFLAGRPKIGKSFMTLQMCASIVTGQNFLGHEVMQRGRVLYISLEDNRRRLKKRIMNMGLYADAKDLSSLEIEERWDPLNKGGNIKLIERLSKKKYVLCVIDTYAKAFLMKDNNDAVEATRVLAPLYELTRGGDFSFEFVDHHRKNNQYSGDVIDDISGSGAKGGVADTVWSLRRERGKQDAFLEIASRDAEIDRIDLVFDKDRTLWVPKEQELVKPGTIQAKILSHMGNNGTEVYIRELSKKLGYDPSLISREMGELINKGIIYKEVEKKERGKVPYRLTKNRKTI